MKDLAQCCSPRCDSAVVDKPIECYSNPDDEKDFVIPGLKPIPTEVTSPAREVLLTFFLTEEDPEFAQIALQCLPPDELQLPFGRVLLAAENSQYIAYALQRNAKLYAPLRRDLTALQQHLQE